MPFAFIKFRNAGSGSLVITPEPSPSLPCPSSDPTLKEIKSEKVQPEVIKKPLIAVVGRPNVPCETTMKQRGAHVMEVVATL